MQLYGENFLTPEEGARLARVRAEELSARRVVFRGAGTALSLRPGYTFKLEDHPRFDGEYLVTELTHAGNDFGGLRDAAELLGLDGPQGDGYHVELVAIPQEHPAPARAPHAGAAHLRDGAGRRRRGRPRATTRSSTSTGATWCRSTSTRARGRTGGIRRGSG